MIYTPYMFVTWLVPQRVMCLLCVGQMTNKDCWLFDETLVRALDQATEKIHLVAQGRDIKTLPSLKTMLGMRYMRHPMLGTIHTASYSQDPILRFLVAAVSSATQTIYKELPTFEAACLNAVRTDATLPPLSEWTLPPQAVLSATTVLPQL